MAIEIILAKTDAEGFPLGGSAGYLKQLLHIVQDKAQRDVQGFSAEAAQAIQAYWEACLAYEKLAAVKPAKSADELHAALKAVMLARAEVFARADEIKAVMVQFKIRFSDGGDINDKGYADLGEQRFFQEFITDITLGNREVNKLRLLTITDDHFLGNQLYAEIKLQRLIASANLEAMAANREPLPYPTGAEALAGDARYKVIRAFVQSNKLSEEESDYLSWVDGPSQNILAVLLSTLPAKVDPKSATPAIDKALVDLRMALTILVQADNHLFAGHGDALKANLIAKLGACQQAHRPCILRWMLDHTMGAVGSFARRKAELQAMLDGALDLQSASKPVLAARAEEEVVRQGIEFRAHQISDLEVFANFIRSVGPEGALRQALSRGKVIHYSDTVFATHGQFKLDNFVRMCKHLRLIAQDANPAAEYTERAQWEALFAGVNQHFNGVAAEFFAHVDQRKPVHEFPRYADLKLMLELAEPSRTDDTVIQVRGFHNSALDPATAEILSRFGWQMSRAGHMPVTGGQPRVLSAKFDDGRVHYTALLDSMNGRSGQARGGYLAVIAQDSSGAQKSLLSLSLYTQDEAGSPQLVKVLLGHCSPYSFAPQFSQSTVYATGAQDCAAMTAYLSGTFGARYELYSIAANSADAFLALPASVLDQSMAHHLIGQGGVKLIKEQLPATQHKIPGSEFEINFESQPFSIQSVDLVAGTVVVATSYGAPTYAAFLMGVPFSALPLRDLVPVDVLEMHERAQSERLGLGQAYLGPSSSSDSAVPFSGPTTTLPARRVTGSDSARPATAAASAHHNTATIIRGSAGAAGASADATAGATAGAAAPGLQSNH